MVRRKRGRVSIPRITSSDKLLLLDAQRLAHIGSWEWDITKDRVRWSDELYRIYGVERRDFDGTYAAVLDKIHPPDRPILQQLVSDALQHKRPFELEHGIVRPDGSTRRVRAHGAVVTSRGGKPHRLIGTAQDITEQVRNEEDRRELERQLRHIQKMEALGQLAGGVAHDFNNVLTSIRGCCELLLRRMGNESPEQRMIERMVASCDQATHLAQQLVAFSRTQKLQPATVSLNEIVCKLEELLQRTIGEDIEIVKLLEPELWTVTVDEGQIGQVIVNLAVNARDAMPNGGRLTIETKNTHLSEPESLSRTVAPGDYVVLAVSDNGLGMDDSTRARIFEPFFTTKPAGKGTGLGLATVYGIVKQNAGDIRVESAVHRGTSFEILLPRCAEAPNPRAVDATKPIEVGTETILVVEDDALAREVTCTFLKELGYQVLEAPSGSSALVTCATYKPVIDLMIADVIMPKINGPRLVQRARMLRDDFAVLYISGHPDGIEGRVDFLGQAGFLQKPFTQRDLARKVRELCDARTASHSRLSATRE